MWLWLLLLLGLSPSKHGAEDLSRRRAKGNITMRMHADGFVHVTSPDVDFWLAPPKYSAPVEVTQGTPAQVQMVFRDVKA